MNKEKVRTAHAGLMVAVETRDELLKLFQDGHRLSIANCTLRDFHTNSDILKKPLLREIIKLGLDAKIQELDEQIQQLRHNLMVALDDK